MAPPKGKKQPRSQPSAQPARRYRWAPIASVILGVGLIAAIAVGGLSGCGPKAAKSPAKSMPPAKPAASIDESGTAAPPSSAAPADEPKAASAAKPNFEMLKGRWLRPDGGYVLEIRTVEDGGKLVATYSNPKPIRVSKAEASQDGKAIKVFIELRDVNYPGCTYDLTYDPQSDSLKGIYYQAALRQGFEVFFERMK